MSTPPTFDRRFAAQAVRARLPGDRQPAADPEPQPDSLLTARPGASTGRLWRTVRAAFTGTRSSRELAELAGAVQVPLSTGRRIAVVSVHGGAGKSTVAAVLASLLAARRPDPVLAADADPYEGSLTWRLGMTGRSSLAELAPSLIAARGGDLRAMDRLLPRTSSGLWVLPSGAPGQPKLCSEVTRALSRLFAVCVTDCPPGIDSWTTSSVLAEAHGVVIVSSSTADGVRATYRALQRVVGAGHASWLLRVVVVLNDVHPDGRLRVKDDVAANMMSALGVPVMSLPYDRHLAGGGLLVPSRISEATLVEATRIAGDALGRAWPL